MFKGYTYKNLQDDIQKLKIIYPFLEIGNIGYTVLGRSIPYIRIGTGIKEIFYNASFHANEWITTPLLMKFIKEYCFQYLQNKNLMEFKARDLYENVSLYIVPMINPDGVDLVTGSLKNVDNSYKNAQEIAKKFPNIVFPSGWKANIEGVDLNLQFPAGWEQAKKIKYAQGFDKPAPRDYVGDKPLIAPESLAVYNFTLKHNFRLVIAYHTQGKEIYWNFQNYTHPKAEYIGKKFSASFAGYKDWFIQKYSNPGYTIEAGIGENPLPETQFDEIYENNFKILVLGMVL